MTFLAFLSILADAPMPDGFMGWLIAGLLGLLGLYREAGRFGGKSDKVTIDPQPFSVQRSREPYASSDALKAHADKIHGRVDAVERRVNDVVSNVNAAITEIKVHLAKMDERSASNHQQILAFGERLNHVAEDIAALRGRKG
jgi:hypothetical protein